MNESTTRPDPEAHGALVPSTEIREAAGRLRGVARRTPLIARELPDGHTVWLKCENLQHGGAFKLRGAYNFTSLLPEEERSRGLVTFSSGNHAQGVAFAARAFGVEATIVMPTDAPGVKVRGTRRLGGRVVFEGTTTPERRARAEEIVRDRGATMVPPFDHPAIVAGQGTVALEAWAQLREAVEVEEREDTAGEAEGSDRGRASLFLVPIGGGGLISGCAALLRELEPSCRIVGVEPAGAASMKRSLEAGRPTEIAVETIADGLKPVRPGELTFRHCAELVDEVVTVSEEALREAVMWHFRQRLVVEPSGAATVAALLEGAVRPPAPAEGGSVVAVVSGGNVDHGLLAGWLAEEAAAEKTPAEETA